MKRTLGTVSGNRKVQRVAADDAPAPRKRYATDAKANRWMITLNFGEEDELAAMSHRATIALNRFNAACQVSPCTYAIFQPEKGESGRLHLQAYVELKERWTLKKVREHFGSACYCEPAQGTQEECIAYCSKETDLDADPPVYGRIEDGEVHQFGEPMKVGKSGSTRGSRTDWADVWAMVKQGAKNTDILEKHPAMIPNVRAIQHARFAVQCETSRDWTTKLLVLWGHPDTGKTTTAISLCEPGKYFVVAADGKQLWWDGYDPMVHDTIIFDEFVGSRCPITFMNQLCDMIDVNVQTKGGFTRFLAKRVIITSNFSPREWYKNCVESRQESLWRRIATEVEFRLIDEIVDIHGDPTNTERRLELEVHKGFWDARLTKSRYPWADSMSHLVKRPVNNDSSDSEDLVCEERLPRMSGRKVPPRNPLVGSRDSPLSCDSSSDSEDENPSDAEDTDSPPVTAKRQRLAKRRTLESE